MSFHILNEKTCAQETNLEIILNLNSYLSSSYYLLPPLLHHFLAPPSSMSIPVNISFSNPFFITDNRLADHFNKKTMESDVNEAECNVIKSILGSGPDI